MPDNIIATHERLDAIGREHEAHRDGDTVLDAGAVTIAEVLGVDAEELEAAALERTKVAIALAGSVDTMRLDQFAGILKGVYVDAFLVGAAWGRARG